MTKTILPKVSFVLAVLYGMVAGLFLVLPVWQVVAGEADGIMPFVVCGIFAVLFALVGAGLFACFRYTRSGMPGLALRVSLWCFVSLAGLGISAAIVNFVSRNFAK